jgi:hypothetical protein
MFKDKFEKMSDTFFSKSISDELTGVFCLAGWIYEQLPTKHRDINAGL